MEEEKKKKSTLKERTSTLIRKFSSRVSESFSRKNNQKERKTSGEGKKNSAIVLHKSSKIQRLKKSKNGVPVSENSKSKSPMNSSINSYSDDQRSLRDTKNGDDNRKGSVSKTFKKCSTPCKGPESSPANSGHRDKSDMDPRNGSGTNLSNNPDSSEDDIDAHRNRSGAPTEGTSTSTKNASIARSNGSIKGKKAVSSEDESDRPVKARDERDDYNGSGREKPKCNSKCDGVYNGKTRRPRELDQ